MLGRSSWNAISLTQANYQSYLSDCLAKGFNAIELSTPHRDTRGYNTPFCGNGAAPFTKLLDGTAWDGSFTYGSNAPDFTQPNETYWSFVDTFLDYCASRGIACHLFPAYVGYTGTSQGWMTEMVANGTTKMQTYGAWIATRWKTRGNIVWMLGGDQGTAPNTFTTAQSNVESALITGLKSVTGQTSTLYSAEWNSPSIGQDQTSFGTDVNFSGTYDWTGGNGTQSRRAYSASPTVPAFLDEEPYDQEGPDGNNANPNATQPVRRFVWWGWINAIGGYCAGNGYVWPFDPAVYPSHLSTQGALDCSHLNAFIQSIAWYNLVPDGLGTIGTLVTSGGGTIDTSNYVAAAATPDGSLLIAYASPSFTSFTVDMTKLRGTVTARWYDPTAGTYTTIGSLGNTGTHTFSSPGNNSAAAGDWVLRLDA